MARKIKHSLKVKQLRVMLALGVLEQEKQAKQPVCFDVEVQLQPQPLLPLEDDLKQVFDYRILRDQVLQLQQQPHTELLETVVGNLAQQLLAYPQIGAVKIFATKTEIFPDCNLELRLEVEK